MPDVRAEQIRTRQSTIRTELDALEQLPEADATDRLRADALLQEWDELDEELKPLAEREERILAVRQASTHRLNREVVETVEYVPTPEKSDPFAGLDDIRAGTVAKPEIRGRARQAIDNYAARSDSFGLTSDAAQQATRLVESAYSQERIEENGDSFGTNVARHILDTGSPEYMAVFNRYLRDPKGYAARAAMSLTLANGGYLVPFTLDPTIILTNAGSANPYRQVAESKSTTTNDWNGVTSAGVTAEWTSEGTEAADASPTVGQLKITPQKADAYLFGSYEVLSDSDFAAQLPGLLLDAKDRIEETAFAIGTGTGQPKGIIPAGTSQNRAGTTSTGPVAQDVYALMAALPARFRGPRARNVWAASLTVINSLRQIPSFTGSVSSIVNDNGPVPTMLGRPFLESTSIVSVFTTGSKVLAFLDASQYYIVDRIGMSVVFDPAVLGSNRRLSGQSAWYAYWRVGADVSTATAVRVFATLT